ncbi:MAG: hypothetical protein HC896_16450 [Bacteroidales bacterium]|nr:hypothetical protein [Bacteroidales bacterium]
MPPYPLPTGMATSLYAANHGNKVLKSNTQGIARYHQPYKMAGISPVDSVTYLDIVVTGSDKEIFVHAINRHFSSNISCKLSLMGWQKISENATLMSMVENQGCNPDNNWAACIRSEELKINPENMVITFPKKSVSVLRVSVKE